MLISLLYCREAPRSTSETNLTTQPQTANGTPAQGFVRASVRTAPTTSSLPRGLMTTSRVPQKNVNDQLPDVSQPEKSPVVAEKTINVDVALKAHYYSSP